MLTHTSRWSHAHGNGVVPSRWQATVDPASIGTTFSGAALGVAGALWLATGSGQHSMQLVD
jgi:hypothetical protein